jgi:hypothetical protein
MTGAQFKSVNLLPLPATDGGTCAALPTAGGVRPLCAKTTWTGTQCKVTGLNTGCACFEGQAQACDTSTGNACPSGTGCGVKKCMTTTSDTSSSWSACTTAP